MDLVVIGQMLGPYHVLSKLGEGGMGEVYRAHDQRLGREVALKVLPGQVAVDPDRLARFEREARAVAALNHPNIVTLFSVEHAPCAGSGEAGVHFLTMELVEGEPLGQHIPRHGCPIDQVLAIGGALADALAAAHDKGIVHRDLKPANIMLTTDGRVKVLDFGLAKEMRESPRADATMTAAGHTQAGMVMGTPAYMSPEQLAGRPLDHRSDIFSFGILLYELCSGQRPFEGSTSIELASAILRDTPRPLEEVRTDVPADLARLVRRCLEKDPQRRVQTARDVGNELRDIVRDRASGPRRTARASAVTPADEGFWIGVRPFKYSGSIDDVKALAEGLSEEIVAGLSKFSYLRVMARAAAAGSREPTARYLIEGSIRQSGSTLRVSAQLVDSATGAHLWAETYNRPFQPEAIFDVQDDLVPRIVSTVADDFGVLPRAMGDALRGRDSSDLTPYEAVLLGKSFYGRISADDHAGVRGILERAVEQAKDHGDAWALLSALYLDEYRNGFNPRPNALDRALAAAHRAVELAPSTNFVHQALASVLYFRRDLQAFRPAAERAIALNGMDGAAIAYLGALIAFAGDWPRGCELVERAIRLNPHHPGWYWLPLAYNAYRHHDYAAALDAAVKVNMPHYFWWFVALAAVHGQLGDWKAAQEAVQHLLQVKPDIARTIREELSKWFVDRELVELLLDGLRKGGFEDVSAGTGQGDRQKGQAGGTGTGTMPPPAADRGVQTASVSPSIAVLPFANMSADKDQEYFSDGLAEEIINLLSHITGLKVIARTSAFAFRGRDEDIRRIAQALDVTHVLEGSVRRAGERVRVTTQLITATDGAQIWSERYDRELSDIFAVQDEIAAAITRALRVTLSIAALPQRYQPKLPAYEAYLRARHHLAKVTPESMELARRCYESAVELDPAFGLAQVGIGFYWLGVAIFGGCSTAEAATNARAAVQRALQTDPSIPEAHALLGFLAGLYDLDWAAAERHFELPLTRQAGFAIIRPIYGGLQFFRGHYQAAIEMAERAIEEDPLEVWPRMNLHAYLQAVGRDKEAYEQAMKVLELDPNLVPARVSSAHFHADWGQLPEAVAAARQAYASGSWYPDAVATLAALLRRTGEEAESRALYDSLGAGERADDVRARAVYHLLCGDIDQAADFAEKAIALRDNSMMYYLRFVISRPLRASTRWPAIARMLNLPA